MKKKILAILCAAAMVMALLVGCGGGNVMTESVPFKGGYPQQKHHALCLETQSMPDSMHYPHFTDGTLAPGEVFASRTVYAFSVR